MLWVGLAIFALYVCIGIQAGNDAYNYSHQSLDEAIIIGIFWPFIMAIFLGKLIIATPGGCLQLIKAIIRITMKIPKTIIRFVRTQV